MQSITKKRISSITISMIVVLAMMFGIVALQTKTADAATTGKLVSQVKIYEKSGSKWKLWYTDSYTYNSKKDPTKITRTFKSGNGYKEKYTMSYKYESGKKVSAIDDYNDLKITYNKKGRRISMKTDFYNYKISYNKKGRISKISDREGSGQTNFRYKYYKNGKAKALKTGGSSGVSNITQFTKKGYVTHFRSFNVAEPYQDCEYHFNKNGRISYVIVKMNDGGQSYYTKYVFKYKNKKIPMKRYKAMINSIMAGDGYGSGEFWY